MLEGLCKTEMRIEATEERERKWEHLKEATGENTKSGALDTAADFYIRMRGNTTAVPNGAFAELLQRADQEGSLTLEEIADVLDTEELPVDARTEWSVGQE